MVSFTADKLHTVSLFPEVSTVLRLPSLVFIAFCFCVEGLQPEKQTSNKAADRSKGVVFMSDSI